MAFGEELNEQSTTATQRALRVLARSVLRELKRSGYSRTEMVTLRFTVTGSERPRSKSEVSRVLS